LIVTIVDGSAFIHKLLSQENKLRGHMIFSIEDLAKEECEGWMEEFDMGSDRRLSRRVDISIIINPVFTMLEIYTMA